MKKLYFSSLLIFISFSSFGQILNIPDANFKNALINYNCAHIQGQLIDSDADTNNDGEIEVSEAAVVDRLYIPNLSITSIAGIEQFTNLYYLGCENNQLTSINISSLYQLNTLFCSNNLLNEIRLCGTAVSWLDCSSNPNLTYVSVKNNVISPLLRGTNVKTPPAMILLNFAACPALSTICYDEGELEAVQYTIHFTSINLVTDCPVDCFLNFENFKAVNKFNLTPNPASNILNIDVPSGVTIQSIAIYNPLGQLVKTFTDAILSSSSSIDVSALKTGTYFMEINSNQGKTTQKFVKI
ncbi:MAG: T9SS type A sorting domain-containing protein [Flavobacterium sp.]|nr:T9SS type A sorting domain-containing protein [Flavobacterium sp.]